MVPLTYSVRPFSSATICSVTARARVCSVSSGSLGADSMSTICSTVLPANCRESSRPIERTSSAARGGSSVTARAVIQPASVTRTASARSSSRGISSTRARVVFLSGGASRRPVSFVATDRCDDVRSMNGSMPERRVGKVPVMGGASAACGGGNEFT